MFCSYFILLSDEVRHQQRSKFTPFISDKVLPLKFANNLRIVLGLKAETFKNTAAQRKVRYSYQKFCSSLQKGTSYENGASCEGIMA